MNMCGDVILRERESACACVCTCVRACTQVPDKQMMRALKLLADTLKNLGTGDKFADGSPMSPVPTPLPEP